MSWKHVQPKRGDRCLGCSEPLRGPIVEMEIYQGIWHMHCALTRALKPAEVDMGPTSPDPYSVYSGRSYVPPAPGNPYLPKPWSKP